jgi:hypothetical protein
VKVERSRTDHRQQREVLCYSLLTRCCVDCALPQQTARHSNHVKQSKRGRSDALKLHPRLAQDTPTSTGRGVYGHWGWGHPSWRGGNCKDIQPNGWCALWPRYKVCYVILAGGDSYTSLNCFINVAPISLLTYGLLGGRVFLYAAIYLFTSVRDILYKYRDSY